MEKSLYQLAMEAKRGDKPSMMSLIQMFYPLINKYSRKLNYDGASTDLVINLIEVIKDLPIHNLKKQKNIIAYISKSTRYKYIKLSKKYNKICNSEIELDENLLECNLNNSIDDNIIVLDLMDRLSKKQRSIIEKIFIEGFNESQIAREFKISRQAVNSTKKRALDNLKDMFREIN